MKTIIVIITILVCSFSWRINSAPIDKNNVYDISLDDIDSNQLLISFNQQNLQINLTDTMPCNVSTEMITNDKTINSTTVNGCQYYNGIVFGETGYEIGMASLLECNKSLNGVLTIQQHMYQLYSIESKSYQLKTISSSLENSITNNEYRIKRDEHLVTKGTIEVLLVADEIMNNYHKDTDMTLYLLNIMNTVSHLFRHPSLESIIKFAIVKIVVFQGNELDLSGNENGVVLRDKFCEWKNSQQYTSDIAILLTRRIICESDEQCSIVGVTNFKSICTNSINCIIVKETGLSTAFTIAHEIGHSLGIHHDGDKNVNCNEGYNIMASSFEGSTNPHVWSACSKQQLHDFFSTSQSECLNHVHYNESLITISAPLLGRNYSLDHQCTLLVGSNATACNKMNCSILWCSVDDGVTCNITQYSPPAAGSHCSITNNDNNHLCYNGECVDSVSTVVHGEWGHWSQWSDCSVTCNEGIQHSDRECNSPIPQYSGSYCEGVRRKYRICNDQDCPENTKQYRDKKCAELGPIGHSSNNNHWISVSEEHIALFSNLDPCKLYCQREGSHHELSLLENSVSNGVSCYYSNHRGYCIDGECIKVGCDGILNTHTYTDMCGVLCGDNSSCIVIDEMFTTDASQSVVIIPIGSTDIRIKQITHSNSYIIIEDLSTGEVYDTSTGHDYGVISHVVFEYHDSLLYAEGPLQHDTQIKIIIIEGVTTVNYKYKTPINDNSKWIIISDWNNCSSVCGNGSQTRTVLCQLNGQTVNNKHCIDPKPATNQVCTSHDSCYYWSINPWSECSTDCGVGISTRLVTCKHIDGYNVYEQYCNTVVKPNVSQMCNATDCPEWKYSSWTQCSVSCGNGQQVHTVQCLNNIGQLSLKCDNGSKPATEYKICNNSDCPTDCVDQSPECGIIKRFQLCGYYMKECCQTCTV